MSCYLYILVENLEKPFEYGKYLNNIKKLFPVFTLFFGAFPCLALGAQISPLAYFLFFFENKGGVVSFFFQILAPAVGSNQTSFLTLQGILHGSPTLRAPFLALRGKKNFTNKRFQCIINGHHNNFST